jgi:hypothetical protein
MLKEGFMFGAGRRPGNRSPSRKTAARLRRRIASLLNE